MIDFSSMLGGGAGNISGMLGGIKDLIPSFGGIMQTYLKHGESEIIALGMFEPDKEGKICPMVRLGAFKKEILFDANGKEVKKMVLCRIVKDAENKTLQWNLLDFLNMIPDGNKENQIEQ